MSRCFVCGPEMFSIGCETCMQAERKERQERELSAARKVEAEAVEALLLAARHTWDTIPAECDGPMADAHAAALHNLKHAITDLDTARAEVRRLEEIA